MSKLTMKMLTLSGMAVAVLGLTRMASASITFDLRVDSATGSAAKIDAKTVSVAGPTTTGTVSFSLYAVVTDGNQNPADDGFQTVRGYIYAPVNSLSNPAGATGPRGSLGSAAVISPFDGSGYVLGNNNDLNADTYLDLGGTSSGYIGPRSAAVTKGGPEFKFFTFTMSVADLGANGGLSTVNFARTGANTTVVWMEDNVGKNASSGSVLFGTDVVLKAATSDVPEPASLGVLALGGLALLARRCKTA